jgi:arylsulfatase A-like enzyme
LYIPRPDFQSQLPDDPYLAEILYTDHHIGELIRHLENSGLRSRTLIALTSDHGEGLGEHGEESHAFFVYDSTLRVPLIFWGPPRLPAGKRIASLVRTVDIAPTILDLLGLPELSSVQGTSLLPLIRGETQALDLPAYGESIEIATLFNGAPLRSLRYGDWKYIHQVDPELYDVANDPLETKNLAASQPEKLAELRGRLQALIAEAGPAPGGAAVRLDQATAQQLQALGYVAAGEIAGLDEKLASLELIGPSPGDVAEDIGRYARPRAWPRTASIARPCRSCATRRPAIPTAR